MDDVITRALLVGRMRLGAPEPAFREVACAGAGFAMAARSPFTGRASLFADRRGARLDVALPAGPWDILLTRHPWSGRVLVRDARRYRVVELYAAHAEAGIERIPVHSAGEEEPVSVEVTGESTPASRGRQAWFLGAARGAEALHPERGTALTRTCRLVDGAHGRFLALRTDSGVADSLAEAGVWEADSVALFRKVAAPGATVVDVGANIGHHSVVLSSLVGPAGRVLAFEPQLRLFNVLAANLALNGCANVQPFRMALGAKEGSLRMVAADYDHFANFGSLGIAVDNGAAGQVGGGEVVPVSRLDRVLDDLGCDPASVGLIKLDVQTFELFVLRGAEALIAAGKPAIHCEIAPYWIRRRGYDYREIYEFLARRGYRFYDDALTPLQGPPAWNGTDRLEWSLVALRT